MRILCWIAVIVVAGWSGCSASVASLSFVSPAPGSSFMRDQLGSSGALIAPVGVEVDVGGDVARVAFTAGEAALGDLAGGKLAAEVPKSGAVTLTATAYNDDGDALLTASVDVIVTDPTVANCHGWL